MLRDVPRVAQFGLRNPKSFLNVNVWARKEVARGDLTRLADRAGTDKGLRRHFYTRVYEDLFRHRRSSQLALLELGLLRHDVQWRIGGRRFTSVPSLDMWAAYFPRARIYGLDDKDFSAATGLWKQIVQADQAQRSQLEGVTQLESSFDIIIDDALHASHHQQISFSYLFRSLAPGGLYMIEDLHYQPDWAERSYPADKTSSLLRTLQASGTWASDLATGAEKAHIEEHIDSVQFFDSMESGMLTADSLAVIRKRED